jgi:8-oxo-dGTP pyrophosphatase MutT (NUDIX family)
MIEADESPVDAARRELDEEAQAHPVGEMHPLLDFFPEPAFTDHRIFLFACVAERSVGDDAKVDQDVIEAQWVSLSALMKSIHQGESMSSWSVLGIILVTGLIERGELCGS